MGYLFQEIDGSLTENGVARGPTARLQMPIDRHARKPRLDPGIEEQGLMAAELWRHCEDHVAQCSLVDWIFWHCRRYGCNFDIEHLRMIRSVLIPHDARDPPSVTGQP